MKDKVYRHEIIAKSFNSSVDELMTLNSNSIYPNQMLRFMQNINE